ncbi:MAG: UDP-N-acetylmuramate--L-alanine ligase [Clostridiales Family XIII bacterium]|jgi:UDP-N-acetylmuramate--alanine ligase|nr:UDP-N-acetylmuramate--L-alanine ligase [Clostridiales Family XIII bacterium]
MGAEEFFTELVDFNSVHHVHCIGIGGIGLSAIAEILLNKGFAVSGSDSEESDITDRLISRGAKVYLGHREKNIGDAELVIYSAAVPQNNPELRAARAKGVPACTRAEALGELMKGAESSIAVAGAHGKTTTTSMISLILRNAGKEPTILVGGNLSEIGGNVAVGGADYFITEACEYMDSFLALCPKYAIILNIDSDHLDYFKDIDHIVRSFERFANLVPPGGAVFAFDANPFVSSILKDLKRTCVTFGFHEKCNYRADNIEFGRDGFPTFSIAVDGEPMCRIRLQIPGEHNIANALASVACCITMGIDLRVIVETLEGFKGTQRRFDIQGYTTGGVKIVDDYAHHPAEIAATVEAARKIPHEKMWLLFQPHTYTRTLALHDDFAEALASADKIVLTEIYAAREKNTHNVSSKSILEKMRESNPGKEVWYIENFGEIADFVLANAQPGDLVITMGAGDIYQVGETILEKDRLAYMGQANGDF